VNPVSRRKDSPLNEAARREHLSVVKLLVKRGADVTLKNEDDQIAREWREVMKAKVWQNNWTL
jgi:ankyrin repeat protein